jgi:hypothetical protein
MLVTDVVATALTKLGAPRHAETTRSGDIPEHWPTAVLRSICACGGRSTHGRMSLRGGPLQRSR